MKQLIYFICYVDVFEGEILKLIKRKEKKNKQYKEHQLKKN